jgi:thioredoxin 1
VTAKKILPGSAAILPLHDQPSRGQVSTYTELQRKIITTSGCNRNGSTVAAIRRSAISTNAASRSFSIFPRQTAQAAGRIIQQPMQLKGEPSMKRTVEVTEANFEREVLKSSRPVLVGFAPGWSFSAPALEEVFGELATDFADYFKAARVALDLSPNLGLWYGIRCIPTFLCFVDGEDASEFLG